MPPAHCCCVCTVVCGGGECTQDPLRSLAQLFDNKLCREQQVREKAPDFDVQERVRYLPSLSQRASWNDPCSAGIRVCIENVKKMDCTGNQHDFWVENTWDCPHQEFLDASRTVGRHCQQGLETWNPLPLGDTRSRSDPARSAKFGTQCSVSPFLS